SPPIRTPERSSATPARTRTATPTAVATARPSRTPLVHASAHPRPIAHRSSSSSTPAATTRQLDVGPMAPGHVPVYAGDDPSTTTPGATFTPNPWRCDP